MKAVEILGELGCAVEENTALLPKKVIHSVSISIFIGFILLRFSISMDSAFLNLWLPSIVPYASIDIYAHFRGQDFCRRLLIHENHAVIH